MAQAREDLQELIATAQEKLDAKLIARELGNFSGVKRRFAEKDLKDMIKSLEGTAGDLQKAIAENGTKIEAVNADLAKALDELRSTDAKDKEEAARKAEAERKAAAAAKYHTIRQGDTLGALARKYHTTVRTLCNLNGIKETTILRLGKKLRVK